MNLKIALLFSSDKELVTYKFIPVLKIRKRLNKLKINDHSYIHQIIDDSGQITLLKSGETSKYKES